MMIKSKNETALWLYFDN